jgi:AcrR family transcriptional regulator
MASTSARTRTTKAPEDRRRDLMDAGLRVFCERGMREATISDITAAAGVAKGTFYLYFDSKEHLLAALKERFVQTMMSEAFALFGRIGQDDWWDLTDRTIEAMVDFPLRHPDELKVFYFQTPSSPETQDILEESDRRVWEMASASIRAGIDAGVFSTADPELAALFIHEAIDGAVRHKIMYGIDVDRDRLVAAAQEMARKLLAPERSGP